LALSTLASRASSSAVAELAAERYVFHPSETMLTSRRRRCAGTTEKLASWTGTEKGGFAKTGGGSVSHERARDGAGRAGLLNKPQFLRRVGKYAFSSLEVAGRWRQL